MIKVNRKDKAGGGICIFTKDDLKAKLRNDLNFESLFIEIINEKAKNIIVGTIYHPPNNNFYEFEIGLKRYYQD